MPRRRRERWHALGYLEELAALEVQERAGRRIARLTKTAKPPRDKTLATLDVTCPRVHKRRPPRIRRPRNERSNRLRGMMA